MLVQGAPEAMRALVEAPWEGNVRELRNVVESLVVLAPNDEIGVDDIPEEYRAATSTGGTSMPPAAAGATGAGPTAAASAA